MLMKHLEILTKPQKELKNVSLDWLENDEFFFIRTPLNEVGLACSLSSELSYLRLDSHRRLFNVVEFSDITSSNFT